MINSKGKYVKSADGANIYYEVAVGKNRKKCLVFLHGLTGNLTAWNEERKHFLKNGMSSIALDLRGHGYSDRSADLDFYKMDKFTQDVMEVMNSEGFDEYAIVGHCFGGMIAIVLEANHPKVSKGLVLVDTSFKRPLFVEPIYKHDFLKWVLGLIAANIPEFNLKGHVDYRKYLGTSDFDPNRILHDLLHTSLKSFLLICELLVEYNAIQLLKKIRVPTLVVDGTNDSIFPPKVAQALNKRIKRSFLDLIPGANHVLVINNPEDLSREMEKFFEKTKFFV